MGKKWILAAAACLLSVCILGCAREEPPTEPSTEPSPQLPVPATAAVEPAYIPAAADNFYIAVPQGFGPGQQEGVLYTSLREDGSRVSWEKRGYLSDIRKESVAWLSAFLPQNATVVSFSRHSLGRWQAMTLDFACPSQQGWLTAVQTQGELYLFTFADCSQDGEHLDALRSAAASLELFEPGQVKEGELQGTQSYTLATGLTMEAEQGLQAQPHSAYVGVLQGQTCLITFLQDLKSDAGEVETLEQYAQTVARLHQLPDFRRSAFGNLVSEQIRGEYYYFLTVKERDDSFYLCQMVCPAAHYGRYRDRFELWAATAR